MIHGLCKITLSQWSSNQDTKETEELGEFLIELQSTIFDLGSHVATPPSKTSSEAKLRKTSFKNEDTTNIELWIDRLTSKLPKLKNFILPRGSPASLHAHKARTECRRVERLMVALRDQGDELEKEAYSFINRLSDFFFQCARYLYMLTNRLSPSEPIYVNRRN